MVSYNMFLRMVMMYIYIYVDGGVIMAYFMVYFMVFQWLYII